VSFCELLKPDALLFTELSGESIEGLLSAFACYFVSVV